MCNGFMNKLIFLLHMPKGNKNSSMDEIILSFEMDMDKEICKSNLQWKVGGPQFQQHIQKVGNPQPI
jgi:hypothetical protein